MFILYSNKLILIPNQYYDIVIHIWKWGSKISGTSRLWEPWVLWPDFTRIWKAKKNCIFKAFNSEFLKLITYISQKEFTPRKSNNILSFYNTILIVSPLIFSEQLNVMGLCVSPCYVEQSEAKCRDGEIITHFTENNLMMHSEYYVNGTLSKVSKQ